ncbi:hypothetical protein [Halpernia frigidisoli]|uniref:Uncharacterized protein n=1 Tax=Halpernia frigidisoli TaxID=1125876 RepID=A0A1I3FVM0_9FLAO|nr:hypothetical protein [Halpernia frigidisoli]SFI15225.1 hypothetical protein SAMN05443292_1658 [Halpernia frigidisoli]
MFGIILAVVILIFGIFLKITKEPEFQNSKKFAWLFILLGIITLAGKLTLLFLNK